MGAPERSSPVRVRDLLVAAVPELGDRLLEEAIRNEWSRLVGPELGRRSRPGQLRAGALDVTVDSSPVLHEMTLRSEEVAASVQTRFGTTVTSLRLAVGVVATRPDAPGTRPRPATDGRLSREETSKVDEMVGSLPDPMLAGSLRRLLTKDLLARRQPGPSRRARDVPPAEREDS